MDLTNNGLKHISLLEWKEFQEKGLKDVKAKTCDSHKNKLNEKAEKNSNYEKLYSPLTKLQMKKFVVGMPRALVLCRLLLVKKSEDKK